MTKTHLDVKKARVQRSIGRWQAGGLKQGAHKNASSRLRVYHIRQQIVEPAAQIPTHKRSTMLTAGLHLHRVPIESQPSAPEQTMIFSHVLSPLWAKPDNLVYRRTSLPTTLYESKP